MPCDPSSDYLEIPEAPGLTQAFCAKWDPEFAFRGNQCCRKPKMPKRRSANRCAPSRTKADYCDEMTPEQRKYTELASSGKLGDLLAQITIEMNQRGPQAHCGVNIGFLSFGRRLIPNSANRIQLKSPLRCVDFGTDPMVGMLEWLGRKVSSDYNQTENGKLKLLIGDISAPRGGCLVGKRGRRGHASHTSGQDVDIGFLTPIANKPSPDNFHRKFDPVANTWLIKKIFDNPFACIKVIFLDRKLIRKIDKVAAKDPEWNAVKRFVRHVRGHQNHMHVRIGNGPGSVGCVPGADPNLEEEEYGDPDSNDSSEDSGEESIEAKLRSIQANNN